MFYCKMTMLAIMFKLFVDRLYITLCNYSNVFSNSFHFQKYTVLSLQCHCRVINRFGGVFVAKNVESPENLTQNHPYLVHSKMLTNAIPEKNKQFEISMFVIKILQTAKSIAELTSPTK